MGRKKVLNLSGDSENVSLSNVYEKWQQVFINFTSSTNEDLNKIPNNTYNAITLKPNSAPINNHLLQNINRILTTDGFVHIVLSTLDSLLNEDELVNLLIEQNFYQVYNGVYDTNIIAFAFKSKPNTSQLIALGLEAAINKPAYLPTYTKPKENEVTNFFCPVFWGIENPQQVADSINEIF